MKTNDVAEKLKQSSLNIVLTIVTRVNSHLLAVTFFDGDADDLATMRIYSRIIPLV